MKIKNVLRSDCCWQRPRAKHPHCPQTKRSPKLAYKKKDWTIQTQTFKLQMFDCNNIEILFSCTAEEDSPKQFHWSWKNCHQNLPQRHPRPRHGRQHPKRRLESWIWLDWTRTPEKQQQQWPDSWRCQPLLWGWLELFLAPPDMISKTDVHVRRHKHFI